MTNRKLETEDIPELDTSAKKKTTVPLWQCVILVLAGLVAGIYIGINPPNLWPGSQKKLDLASVQKTYDALRQKYDGKLSTDKLIEGANRGLVDAAGDQYTVFMNKKEAEEFNKDLDGTFSGIGAELDKRDGQLVVVTPLDGSPAKAAGLKPRDAILRVNGEDTTKWSIDQAVSKIKGKEGTTVKLTLLREGNIVEITITRAVINVPSVKKEIKGDVGVIKISRFSDDTASLTRSAAIYFKDNDVKKVILDLRGNGGGYLQSAQEVSSLWVEEGKTIVTERRHGKIIDNHKATGNPILAGIPTIVLINGGSASASEIVAGALRDNDAAKLLGETSFGKGSVQTVVDLSGGALLKVTVARWYTPNGKNINKEGIKPDIEYKQPATDTEESDSQLQKAIEALG
jgi:carboxyl-terminal processing protease